MPDLTYTGSIIASVPTSSGQGNKTYNGGAASTDVWIGYQYSGPQTFTKVVFQEGENFPGGGWFQSGIVQVLQNGTWVNVSNFGAAPAYTGNDGTGFKTYTLTFTPVTGTAIRIDGLPSGSAYFVSIGELEVFGQ